MSQGVTLKDIAREANLSVGAVSKALAGYPHISEATRKRVRRISNQLNYQPRGQRRPLGREQRVKLVFGGADRVAQHSGQWFGALTQAATRVDLRFELSGIQQLDGDDWFTELSREVRGMAGVLVFGWIEHGVVEALGQLELPCVMIGDVQNSRQVHPLPIHHVNTDKTAMGRHAVQQLIDAGHRRIGFFCAPYPEGSWNDQWLAGYRLGLIEAGLPDDPAIRPVLHTRNRDEVGVEAARYMAGLDDPPTAYVVPTVRGTARFLETMKRLGNKLGPDRIVMGGRAEEAQDYGLEHYPIFGQPLEEMATLAADLLARLIDNPSLPSAQTLVPFHAHNFPPTPR